MQRFAIIVMTSLLVTTGPVVAAPWLGSGGIPAAPMPARPMPEEEKVSPYPMTYSQEVAQRLGIENGKVKVFEIRPQEDRSTLMPTFSGNLGAQGAMFNMKWKP